MEAQVPYVFSLTTTIPASAQEIYDAWLDSITHSEMTRSKASMSDEVGAEVSAWDGYITGGNLDPFRANASCSRGARRNSRMNRRIRSLR
jgi:hypothetical protein